MIENFYTKFQPVVEDVKENASRESGERILGRDPKSDRIVKVRLGKFGPIAQIGVIDDEDKPIFASLTKDQQLDTITLNEALELFKFPKEIGTYKGETVTVNNGRYGPYLRYSSKSISIPKEIDPHSVNIDSAIPLIDEKLKSHMTTNPKYGEESWEAYHNMWWILDGEKGEFCATGIHGQVIYINRSKNTVMVWFSNQPGAAAPKNINYQSKLNAARSLVNSL